MIKRSLQGVKRSCSGHADELPVTGWLDSALALGVKVERASRDVVCAASWSATTRRGRSLLVVSGPTTRWASPAREGSWPCVARWGIAPPDRLATCPQAGQAPWQAGSESGVGASTGIQVQRRPGGLWCCFGGSGAALRMGLSERAIPPDGAHGSSWSWVVLMAWGGEHGVCGLATSRDRSHGGCGTIGRYDLR